MDTDDARFEAVVRRMRRRETRALLRHPIATRRYRRGRITIAESELNAAAVAVYDLIVDEPWFEWDYEAPGAPEQTPLQRALVNLARATYLPRQADEIED